MTDYIRREDALKAVMVSEDKAVISAEINRIPSADVVERIIARRSALELSAKLCGDRYSANHGNMKKLFADVVERKNGKWVFEDGNPVNRNLKMGEDAFCNQCGKSAPGYPFWECDLMLTKFCPNCGVKMEFPEPPKTVIEADKIFDEDDEIQHVGYTLEQMGYDK